MTLLLIIWGVWSATKLPIDAVPDITNNQVQIFTSCPTLAGQEVEQLVTFPIEQSIANIPNIEEVRSISRFGLSVITVVFKDEVDIYFCKATYKRKNKGSRRRHTQRNRHTRACTCKHRAWQKCINTLFTQKRE